MPGAVVERRSGAGPDRRSGPGRRRLCPRVQSSARSSSIWLIADVAPSSSFSTRSPAALAMFVLLAIVALYCGYKTIVNGRWVLFILGFFCTPLFWVAGAVMGRKHRY